MAVSDWFRIVLLSLVWGGSFFFVEVMLEAMPPMTSVLGLENVVHKMCFRRVFRHHNFQFLLRAGTRHEVPDQK